MELNWNINIIHFGFQSFSISLGDVEQSQYQTCSVANNSVLINSLNKLCCYYNIGQKYMYHKLIINVDAMERLVWSTVGSNL